MIAEVDSGKHINTDTHTPTPTRPHTTSIFLNENKSTHIPFFSFIKLRQRHFREKEFLFSPPIDNYYYTKITK